jgi:HSP20 family protein
MPTEDKTKQQSSFAPTTGSQQGSGQRETAAAQQRSLAPRQGTWLSGRDYDASPFGLMRRLSEDMDRLFENFGFGNALSRSWTGGGQQLGTAAWAPHIEMFEESGKVVVQAELPGLRKEDVKAQIEDDAIILSGERRQESQRKEGSSFLSERSYGSFYRVIPLPDGANAEQAKATYRDGVLRIEVPVAQRQRGRTLSISDDTAQGTTASDTASQQGSGAAAKQPGGAV